MEERKIIVRDKHGKKLEEFSNLTPASSMDAQKELMVAPTINIVSNGESTLTFQMLVESRKWQNIKDPENIYECNNRKYTMLNDKSVVYSGKVVTVTLVETWYLLKYQYVQAHNVDTNVEALDDHTVKILPKTDPKFKLTVNGAQYEDSQVCDSRGVQMPRGSAGYALWAILQGSGWSLGVCDVIPIGFDPKADYGTFNVESDMKDRLYNIQLIQQLYGGILDWDSQNQTLSLRDERKESDFNKWKGYAVRRNKNLSEPPQITWDNSIITRLYPLGNGNLNIKKVNDNKGYVDNFSYTNAVYEGYLQNSNIYDTNDEGGQKTLKFWAERKLSELCKPRKSIQYNIVDVRAVREQSHEQMDINHIAKCYFTDTETGEEKFEMLRIIHFQYDWFHPSQDSIIEVGDKVSNEVELFYQIYKGDKHKVQTDANGYISAYDILLEIPEFYLEDFGYGAGGFGFASLEKITELHAYYEEQNKDGIIQAEAAVQVVADDLKAQTESFTTFVKETDDKFSQSSTRITEISTALDAQIELEASHFEESKEYTKDSVAGLKLYVDGDFATATLNAAYGYTNQKTGELNNSIASVSTTASNALAKVNAIADGGMGDISYLTLQQNWDYPKAEMGVRSGSFVQCAGPLTLHSNDSIIADGTLVTSDMKFDGRKVYRDAQGFLRAQ